MPCSTSNDDVRRARRRSVLAGAIAGGALLLAACGSSGQGAPGADPGNRRLHQLAGDPIFAKLPDGAHHAQLKLTPAYYTKPNLFTGGSWDGPAVALTFTSSVTPRSVFEFYGKQAPAVGWTAMSDGALHVTVVWRKTYPNGAYAGLRISSPQTLEAGSGPYEYTLNGFILPPNDSQGGARG